MRASEPGSTASGRGCGLSMPESFGSYDPATCSWRTSQLSLLGGLSEFLETWPRAGMTRNGTAYRQPPSAPLTSVTASSLWPTPDTAQGRPPADPAALKWTGRSAYKNGQKVQIRLEAAVRWWPTPVRQDAIGARNATSARTKGADSTHHSGTTLTDALILAGDLSLEQRPSGGNRVAGGALNPTWVEWLMGFPIGWTDLGGSETPSSPK